MIIENMSDGDYRALQAVSQSELSYILKSPQHFLHRERLKKETEEMRFGRAFHMALLEPELFKRDYVVMPEFVGMTKEGKPSSQSAEAKAKKKAFIEANAEKICITEEDSDCITGMLNSLLNNKAASKWLSQGESEVVGKWNYRGRECKGRLDRLFDEHTEVEVKTTKNASKVAFFRDMINKEYHFQGSFYRIGFKTKRRIVIAIEKTFPYVINCFDSELFFDLGDKRVEKAFEVLEDCEATNNWYGYSNGTEVGTPPSWALPINEDEMDL